MLVPFLGLRNSGVGRLKQLRTVRTADCGLRRFAPLDGPWADCGLHFGSLTCGTWPVERGACA
eukprot:869530-Alexandrium_andersonii.AAC.1